MQDNINCEGAHLFVYLAERIGALLLELRVRRVGEPEPQPRSRRDDDVLQERLGGHAHPQEVRRQLHDLRNRRFVIARTVAAHHHPREPTLGHGSPFFSVVGAVDPTTSHMKDLTRPSPSSDDNPHQAVRFGGKLFSRMFLKNVVRVDPLGLFSELLSRIGAHAHFSLFAIRDRFNLAGVTISVSVEFDFGELAVETGGRLNLNRPG